MKKSILFFGFLVFNGLFSQKTIKIDRNIEWADYYFINGNYEKAISKYTRLNDEISNDARRNLAKSYAQIGALKKAQKTLQPLVDSNEAEVIDYYHFASYLTENESLRDEYRRKALRLPINNLFFEPGVSIKSPYELINLNINTPTSEFGSFLLEKNNESQLIYAKKQSKKYNRGLKKRIKSKYPIYNLYQSIFDNEQFKIVEEKPFPMGINSVYQDGPASWDKVTNQFYLTRSTANFKKDEVIQLDLYSLDYSSSNKKSAGSLSINLEGYSSIHPSVSTSDRKLYFSSDRPGGFGGMDLYYVTILPNNGFGIPVNLGPDINSSADEIFPFIYNERFLIYSTKKAEGRMKLKLAINSVDIRWNVRDLPKPFNGANDNFSFHLNNDLDYGFLSSNRPSGKGDDDLYAFRFTPRLMGIEDKYSYSPSDTLIVSTNGVLVNDEKQLFADDPLTALFDKEVELNEDVKHGKIKINSNGSFLYKNIAPLKEIDSFSYVINSKYGKSEPIKVILKRSTVSLKKLPKNLQKTFLPIYYNYNESNLLSNYKSRVEAVTLAMRENPQLVVEVSSYSDCRGKREYNLKLSEQRNQTIINYVKNNIEKPERIFGKGYGEDRVKGNNSKDYLILGGTFESLKLAEERKKEFISNGYYAEIKVNIDGLHQIIMGQANTVYEAKKIYEKLKNKGIETWVSRCECCSLTEDQHKLNRKTEFKIIRY